MLTFLAKDAVVTFGSAATVEEDEVKDEVEDEVEDDIEDEWLAL